jgi:hypothetical protein
MGSVARGLIERYRCPESSVRLRVAEGLSKEAGFFTFGHGTTCYGRSAAGYRRPRMEESLYDVTNDVISSASGLCLPFDPTEVIDNLRLERYPGAQDSKLRTLARELYYRVRPMLSQSMRKRIQRFQLKGSKESLFPAWPVDRTVENIYEQLLLLILKATGAERIPFIWFWPEGNLSAAIMTHDVDSESGQDLCGELMDLDDLFQIKASFQIVPERRYPVSPEFLATIRNRGFEIGIQDLNHDGRLFSERNEFLRRAVLINGYAKAYGARGFRAGVLYRRPDWYGAFDFSFDMSIPNAAHLDPQRGGCCTVIPYFIDNILELPVTTTQDYMLFHLLDERSIDLWKTQIDLVTEKSGLLSFIVHPDYAMSDELKPIYRDLLIHLREMQTAQKIWLTLPSAVDQWWRARSKMQLVFSENEWRITGEGAERAVVAYAKNADGRLVYEIAPALCRPCDGLDRPDENRISQPS